MPTNKNQHFVPQFYLRRFSRDQKSIEMHTLRSGLTIRFASIRDQCSKPYYYGKGDSIDSLFTSMEAACSPILDQVAAYGANSLSETNYEMLLLFLMLQRFRTEGARRLGFEQHLEAKRRFGRDLPAGVSSEIDSMPPMDHISMSKMAIGMYPYIYDLWTTILKAPSGCGFVTSDDPVVLFNKAGEQSRVPHSIGLSNSGLMIAFPLDPQTALLMYDSGIYSVTEDAPGRVYLSVEELNRFNKLQFLNCSDALYFQNADSIDIDHLKSFARDRLTERVKFAEFTLDENYVRIHERYRRWNEGDPYDYRKSRLISFQFLPIRSNFSARFLKYKIRPRYDDTRSSGGYFRNLKFYDVCKDYAARMRANKVKPLTLHAQPFE